MSGSNRYYTAHGGISLILLTFLILSLVSFAALSIVSARSDARLTERYRLQTENYYRARNEAQRFLAELDAGAGTGGVSTERGTDRAGTEGAGMGGIITKRFPAGETQELVLEVEPDGEGGYRVLGERMESTVTYDYDSTLPVMRH